MALSCISSGIKRDIGRKSSFLLGAYEFSIGGFLFAFRGNYGPILHQFRDKARYWSKIVVFIPPCIRRPRRNIAIPFGWEKLKWWGYPTVKKL